MLFMILHWFKSFYLKFFFKSYSDREDLVLICYASRTNRELITLPSTFSLSGLIRQYPPHQNGFPEDIDFKEGKANFILGLITSIPARNSDLIDSYGYVPINAKKLNDHIRDYKCYFDYFLRTGIIICNNYYIPGIRSKGYKWSNSFNDVPFVPQLLESPFSDDIFEYDDTSDMENYPYLFYWYQQSLLTIDDDAQEYAYSIKESKMNDTSRASWDKNKDTGDYKYPITQYQAAMRNIGKIQHQLYEPHIDLTVHRLHSVLTNIQKNLRQYVKYNGSRLIGIDVKNCQPYLSTILFNPNFWNNSVTESGNIRLSNLSDNIQDSINNTNLPIMIRNYFSQEIQGDVLEYIRLVSSGRMYEKMVEVASLNNINLNREAAKTLMFFILFSKNNQNFFVADYNRMRKIFENEMFPNVSKLFKIIKTKFPISSNSKQHNRLACLLQNIESNIILNKCCRRIWNEHPNQIPVFTIHDSIMTTAENVTYVREVMQTEFLQSIGVGPTLSVEE